MATKNEFVGILDTKGLDRFSPMEGSELSICMLRAQSNPQRHACVFIAVFPDGCDPMPFIKQCRSAWAMWDFIRAASIELRCRPEDEKTVRNMKKLAKVVATLTAQSN